MVVLGNYAERTDVQTPILGTREGAFRAVLERLKGDVTKVATAATHGLSLQTMQALVRLMAATRPQHVMRSTLVPVALRREYDATTERLWETRIFERALTGAEKEQLQQPIGEGGFSAGGVTAKAAAAFLTGALSAIKTVHREAGTNNVESLRRNHPAFTDELDRATAELAVDTALRTPTLWRADRPLNLKGQQTVWTRAIYAQRRKRP